MIGPHEGRELELMLAGEKHLAAFSDIVPDNGMIDEAIIPEKKFQPYVDKGQIYRDFIEFEKPDGHTLRIVCFSMPPHQWRAQTYLYIRQKIHMGEIDYTQSLDEIFGHLLGYANQDIQDFLKK